MNVLLNNTRNMDITRLQEINPLEFEEKKQNIPEKETGDELADIVAERLTELIRKQLEQTKTH